MFINTKKVYQLDLSEKARNFIEEAIENKTDSLNTLIFLDELTKGSEQETLLLKILGAVKLKDENYIFIDKSEFPTILLKHFHNYKHLSIQNLIVFGSTAGQVGLNTTDLKYSQMNSGSYNVLFSDQLQVLMTQPALKGQLWNSLKKMYNV